MSLKPKPTRFVYVEWADATGRAGWMDTETQEHYDFSPMIIRSIGILVRETKEYLVICHSKSDHDHVNGYISIPKGWITKRKAIKV